MIWFNAGTEVTRAAIWGRHLDGNPVAVQHLVNLEMFAPSYSQCTTPNFDDISLSMYQE